MELVNNRRVIFGSGSYCEIPGILKKQGKSRVFLLAYNAEADCVRRVQEELTEGGIEQVLFDRVTGEPHLALVDSAVALCRQNTCDCVLAIGGGSVIDTAKLVAMLATNDGYCEDSQLNRRSVCKQPLFYIAMPTTCGTGAEATKVAVVFNEKEGWKKAVYDNSMIADTVILDPIAIAELPTRIAVYTGMDAIVHAIESMVSNGANTVSQMYSLAALRLLYGNITKIVDNSEDENAQSNMLLGSYLAGIALTVGAGLAHIVGQPLGALYHVPHGASCSIFLLPTMRLNKDYAKPQFLQIAQALAIRCDGRTYDEVFEELISLLSEMMEKIDAPRRLCDYYPADLDIEAALDNIQSCMSHIKSNPRPSERSLWRELLQMA